MWWKKKQSEEGLDTAAVAQQPDSGDVIDVEFSVKREETSSADGVEPENQVADKQWSFLPMMVSALYVLVAILIPWDISKEYHSWTGWLATLGLAYATVKTMGVEPIFWCGFCLLVAGIPWLKPSAGRSLSFVVAAIFFWLAFHQIIFRLGELFQVSVIWSILFLTGLVILLLLGVSRPDAFGVMASSVIILGISTGLVFGGWSQAMLMKDSVKTVKAEKATPGKQSQHSATVVISYEQPPQEQVEQKPKLKPKELEKSSATKLQELGEGRFEVFGQEIILSQLPKRRVYTFQITSGMPTKGVQMEIWRQEKRVFQGTFGKDVAKGLVKGDRLVISTLPSKKKNFWVEVKPQLDQSGQPLTF